MKSGKFLFKKIIKINQYKKGKLMFLRTLSMLLLCAIFSFSQDWVPDTEIYYRIVFKHSDKCIRPIDGSLQATEAEQWEIDETDETQLWSFEHVEGNYYVAINKAASPNAFDIFSREPNDVVGVYPVHYGPNQQIRFVAAGSGYFYIYDKKNDYTLDVTGSSTDNGARIISFLLHGGDNQQVKFVPENGETPNSYSVGDYAQGGIVFYVDETGQHGLVCAKEDQSEGIRWNAGTNGKTRAFGDGLYGGKANTSIIIAAQVAIGDDGQDYAASICNELYVNQGGVRYSDWYLPSRMEFDLMHEVRYLINATATANGGQELELYDYPYWTSTEIQGNPSESYGWIFHIHSGTDGYAYSYDKSSLHRIRAIRAF